MLPVEVDIRSLGDITESMPGKSLYNKLYQQKHFGIAGDIVKRYIVYKMGGLYCDIGIFWKKDPTPFIDTFDRIVCIKPLDWPLDISMLAYSPNNNVERKFFDILENFETLPPEVRKRFKRYNIMALTWDSTMRALLDSELKESDKVFYWNQDEKYFREWKHLGSWQGVRKSMFGKFGNKPITHATREW